MLLKSTTIQFTVLIYGQVKSTNVDNTISVCS